MLISDVKRKGKGKGKEIDEESVDLVIEGHEMKMYDGDIYVEWR